MRSPFTAPTRIKERRPGISTTILEHHGVRELHITLTPLPGERLAPTLWRLENILREHEANVVRHEVFGSLSALAEVTTRLERLLHKLDWPITGVEGGACSGDNIAGMNVFAVAGTKVEPVRLEGRVVGRVYSDQFARHCVLGDIRADDVNASREEQTRHTFENLEAALDRVGMKMQDVSRTWFFNDDILAWYGPFNVVRKNFFAERRLFDHLVPASTGIGARNPAGAALVAGAWASQPTNGSFAVRELLSPLQCPAPSYGSCFSRAVELTTPGLRRVLVSGTASIKQGGESAHLRDVRKQIQLTMNVIEAILASRQLGLSDVSRATAYFKNRKDAPRFAEWCTQRALTLPIINTESDVCRDELLFELELDAIAPTAIANDGRTTGSGAMREAKPIHA
jgi:enamine deaminase RidA (YjgF/YER057c/UK114 family)